MNPIGQRSQLKKRPLCRPWLSTGTLHRLRRSALMPGTLFNGIPSRRGKSEPQRSFNLHNRRRVEARRLSRHPQNDSLIGRNPGRCRRFNRPEDISTTAILLPRCHRICRGPWSEVWKRHSRPTLRIFPYATLNQYRDHAMPLIRNIRRAFPRRNDTSSFHRGLRRSLK